MKTRWENWESTDGQLSAEYQAERDWAEDEGIRLTFNLCIDFEGNDRFYVRVTDWLDDDVVNPKLFCRFDEAFDYLYDVDCETYVDENWERLRKGI